MKIDTIETDRLLIRGFTKDDALWAYKIWNDPEMGKYLPDEAKTDIDYEYLQEGYKMEGDIWSNIYHRLMNIKSLSKTL